MIAERDTFLQVLAAGPLSYADAIVVFMGEDGDVRARAAYEAFRLMAQIGHQPVIVLSGGLHDPPAKIAAPAGGKLLLGFGIAPDRIVVEPSAANTMEQAREACDLAVLNNWTSLLLVASPYHMPRAFLTVVAELQRRDLTQRLYVIPTFTQTRWWEAPPGTDTLRIDLLAAEEAKVRQYHALGHVASYQEGLDYLKYWEDKRRWASTSPEQGDAAE